MYLTEIVRNKYVSLFNQKPLIIKSPGRVNLLGEHTDYNMGYVLPAAIDKAIYFAINKSEGSLCKLYSVDMNESCEFDVNDIHKVPQSWANYLIGVADVIIKSGSKLGGFNCVFGGDIPIGAGLSSSAAIEGGLAFALNHIFELGMDKLTLVKLAQKAENEFVGVKCGIMDQFINIFGKSGNVLRIDCRSLEYDYFPFDYDNISIVLFNTKVSHSLASSEYNTRRQECGEGMKIINAAYPFIESLRDVTSNILFEFKGKLTDVAYRRCKYVVEENERMIKACESLRNNDIKSFGKLMYQTHAGLSKDYEVSCKELDYMAGLAEENTSIYGARMMGGGFGSCTINLIEKQAVEENIERITTKYKEKFGIDSEVYVTSIKNGTDFTGE